jgi:glutathione S-transferase
MKLFGSTTSPFVRRVRYVALELNINYEWIDTLTEEGQAELRKKSPLWKVPYAEFEKEKIWDSHTIIKYLIANNDLGNKRFPNSSNLWQEENLIHAIDTAIESAINVFYLKKDGVEVQKVPYLIKQSERVDSILKWVQSEIKGNYFFSNKTLSLTELALVTGLDWMQFRNAYPVLDFPILKDFLDHHKMDENLFSTRPSL